MAWTLVNRYYITLICFTGGVSLVMRKWSMNLDSLQVLVVILSSVLHVFDMLCFIPALVLSLYNCE